MKSRLFCLALAFGILAGNSEAATLRFKEGGFRYKVTAGKGLVLDLNQLLEEPFTEPLTWHVSSAMPKWLELDAEKGTLEGLSSTADIGVTSFGLSVLSGEQGALTRITVEVMQSLTVSLDLGAGKEDVAFQFDLDALLQKQLPGKWSYRLVAGPKWLALATSGVLTGTPARADVGKFEVHIEAQSVMPSQPLSLVASGVVLKTHHPVAWKHSPIVLPDAVVGERFRQCLWAYVLNPEGSPVTVKVSKMPPWLRLANDGCLLGRPSRGDIGPVTLPAVADDGQVKAVSEIRFSVRP